MTDPAEWWTIELETKPDFEMAMQRVYAWFECEIIDRAPVRFVAHNSSFNVKHVEGKRSPEEQQKRWFEIERRVDEFVKSLNGKSFHGETFPVFDPNLGPDVYAAFYGTELIFGEITSWSQPAVNDWSDMGNLKLDMDNEYFKGVEALMTCALERSADKFLVGYTDIHPGEDCALAWRGSERLCMDLYDYPDQTKQLIEIAYVDFHRIFDHFDAILKAHHMPSVCWLGVPSFGKLHVPSCDFAALISTEHFIEFSLPVLQREVKPMTQNIYHVDGRGVAQHIDHILAVPEINGIQWVQGTGKDQAIMPWIPLIQKIQAAGKGVIVSLELDELEPFLNVVSPEGIYLFVGAEDPDDQLAIIKRLEKWL